jgi:hypothetical protein
VGDSERRRPAADHASAAELESWGSVSCASSTNAKRATREIDPGQRGRRRSRDGAQHGGADDRGGGISGELDTTTRGTETSTGCTGGFSPCYGASGRLLDDRKAAVQEINCGGRLGFRRRRRRPHKARVWVKARRGRAAAFIGPRKKPPGRAGPRPGARGTNVGVEPDSGSGVVAGRGMTGGARPSAAAGGGAVLLGR